MRVNESKWAQRSLNKPKVARMSLNELKWAEIIQNNQNGPK